MNATRTEYFDRLGMVHFHDDESRKIVHVISDDSGPDDVVQAGYHLVNADIDDLQYWDVAGWLICEPPHAIEPGPAFGCRQGLPRCKLTCLAEPVVRFPDGSLHVMDSQHWNGWELDGGSVLHQEIREDKETLRSVAKSAETAV